MEVLWWLLAVPVGLFGAWVIVCNYACVYLGLVRGEHHSLVPLLGGGSLALAWLLCPVAAGRVWALLPVALDPGSWVCVLAGAYVVAVALRHGSGD